MFSNITHGMKTLIGRVKLNLHLDYTKHRKKPKYGTRYLDDKNKVYQFNSWDDVEWDEEQEKQASEKVSANSVIRLSQEEIEKFETKADSYWDAFYDIHTNRFFKDRHWLFTEFPELAFKDGDGGVRQTVFEIGCGVGNTVLPLMEYSKDKNVFVYCCDFSSKAIDILRQSAEYDPQKCNAFVLDAAKDVWDVPFEQNSVDVVIMIFVLSAINPDRYQSIMHNIHRYLKPGGLVLFRDYGRYDMAQLRFKAGRCLGENFYVRGDGTRVYFFTQDEVRAMFEGVGLEEQENRADRRLQVNRGRLLKMYRVWIQAKYRKPL